MNCFPQNIHSLKGEWEDSEGKNQMLGVLPAETTVSNGALIAHFFISPLMKLNESITELKT